MPFAGITYKVRPGFEEQISEVFSPENFQRVDSPVLRDADGTEIGYLTCTGLFVQGDTMVRVIQHDGGTTDDIRAHMSVQSGVHQAERELMPYLSEPRDTATPAGFAAHFDRSLMSVLEVAQLDNRPAAGLVAVRYQLRPGVSTGALRAALRTAGPRAGLAGSGPIVATLLLAHSDSVIRVLQFEGCDADHALTHLSPLSERWLAPLHLGGGHRMRQVSFLSAAVQPVD